MFMYAEAQTALGRCLVRLGKFEEAEPLLSQGFDTLVEHRGPEDPMAVDTASSLRTLYRATDRPEPR